MSRVTVVMSVFGEDHYLPLAVASVLGQTLRDFEFLIANDGGPRDLEAKLQQFAKRDSRIRVLTFAQNQGLPVRLNQLIAESSGELIARMDADDICTLNRLEQQVVRFKQNTAIDVVYGDTFLIDAEGQPICRTWRPSDPSQTLRMMAYHNYIPHPTVMFRKSSVLAVGGYDEAMRTGQDADLWRRMHHHGCTFSYLPEVLLYYRMHHNNVRRRAASRLSGRAAAAHLCLLNGERKQAFRLRRGLSAKHKLNILLKSLVPAFVLRWRAHTRKSKRLQVGSEAR